MSSVVQEQRIRALERWREDAEALQRALEERLARFTQRLEEIQRERAQSVPPPTKEADRGKPR